MIFTVFVSENSAEEQWRAELLEHSWQQAGQTGELLRLVPRPPQTALPEHILARVEPTLCWTRHPYIDDSYQGYNLPAALLEWLLRDRVDATILLVESGSVLREAFTREIEPGKMLAHVWNGFPSGDGPFRLPSSYTPLQAYCVNRELRLASLQLPLLIHSRTLVEICPRWLELMGLMRAAPDLDRGSPGQILRIALAIAAAEYRLEVTTSDLGAYIIEAENGGREFLDFSDKFDALRASGEYLCHLRAIRRPGVRQACVLDQWYLELGSPPGLVSLNVSANAIWQLCDGRRTLLEIVQELQAAYQIPMPTMIADVTEAAKILRSQGAINLEAVN